MAGRRAVGAFITVRHSPSLSFEWKHDSVMAEDMTGLRKVTVYVYFFTTEKEMRKVWDKIKPLVKTVCGYYLKKIHFLAFKKRISQSQTSGVLK